jgi:hypothetical protein
MIATPHVGTVDPLWLGAFMRLEKPKSDDGAPDWFRGSTVRMEIAAARNFLATLFVAPESEQVRHINGGNLSELERNATHILFWDDDIIPPNDGLMTLLSRDLDMVSGFCTTRGRPVIPCAYRATDDGRYQSLTEFVEGVQEVDAIGCAFTLIKRQVFEALPAPWFQFICSADIRRNVSEDIYFCRMMKKAGFRIWLDFDVQCLHVGQRAYGLEDCIAEPPNEPAHE